MVRSIEGPSNPPNIGAFAPTVTIMSSNRSSRFVTSSFLAAIGSMSDDCITMLFRRSISLIKICPAVNQAF